MKATSEDHKERSIDNDLHDVAIGHNDCKPLITAIGMKLGSHLSLLLGIPLSTMKLSILLGIALC